MSTTVERSMLISQASRHYNAGELIFSCSRPLVHVTKYEHRLFTCDDCLKRVETSIACPTCRKVYYCSEICKQNGWNNIHQYECPLFTRHKPLLFETNGIDYMQRLTLRLYLLLTNQPELLSKEFILHNDMIQTIEQMETHHIQLKETPYFQGILNYFKLYQITDFDVELLLRCYGILHVNSFGMDSYYTDIESNDNSYNDGTQQLMSIEHSGTGLYIEASVFDHSCVPNACALGDRLSLEIRTLQPIEAGERIYIDYIQDIKPLMERKAQLEDRYFFTCTCSLGCHPELTKSFDSEVDYRRFNILNKLIEELKPNDKATANQLYRLMNQRLKIQEQYYAKAIHHPCLALHYYSMLHFIIKNQHLLSMIEDEFIELNKKLLQQLIITYGREHIVYKTLHKMIIPLNSILQK